MSTNPIIPNEPVPPRAPPPPAPSDEAVWTASVIRNLKIQSAKNWGVYRETLRNNISLINSTELPQKEKDRLRVILILAGLIKCTPEENFNLFEKLCRSGEAGEAECALKLLQEGHIDRRLVNRDGEGIIEITGRSGNESLIQEALSKTVVQRLQNLFIHAPFFRVVKIPGLKMILEIYKKITNASDAEIRAFLDYKTHPDGDNQLMLAFKNRDIAMINFCLDYGVNLEAVNYEGKGIFRMAVVELGDPAILQVLLNRTQGNQKLDEEKSIALAEAVVSGREELVQLMLDAQVSVNKTGKFPGAYEVIEKKIGGSSSLSEKIKQRLKVLDGGFLEEKQALKFLAHCFSLRGEADVDGQRVRYEGNLVATTLEKYVQNSEAHYQRLQSGGSDSKKVWGQLSADAQAALKDPETLDKRLAGIPSILAEAMVPEPASLKDRLNSDRPFLYVGQWKGHIIAAAYYKGFLSRANRGEGANFPHFGVETQKVKDLDAIIPMFKSQYVDRKFFQSGINSALDAKTTEYLEQKPQKVGNCSLASLRSAEFAVVYHLFREEYGPEVAKEVARAVKRVRTFQSRQAALENYLALHQDDTEKFPPDLELLRRLFQQKKHEPPEVFAARVKTLTDWAAKRNIPL